jgi:predicted RNA-binding Zn-ribbon protein involved in translation (DUF1610 family)
MTAHDLHFCPFCGSDSIDLDSDTDDRVGPETYYSCPNCGTIGSVGLWRSSA